MTSACRIERMGRRILFLPLIVAAMAVTLPAALLAQDTDQHELTWYTVEIIVFERTSEIGRDAESWPPEPGLPEIADAVRFGGEAAAPGRVVVHRQSDVLLRHQMHELRVRAGLVALVAGKRFDCWFDVLEHLGDVA